MPASISSIKSRIKSINSTKKITGAMKSVSTVKLNRMSKTTIKNREYRDALLETASYVLSSPIDFESKYCKPNDSNKRLYIAFTSDVGLCGSYNSSIIKYIDNNINKEDYIYLIGTSSFSAISKANFNIINKIKPSDDINYYDIMSVFNKATNMFVNGEIGELRVLFNKFKNNISYTTTDFKVLPFTAPTNEQSKEIILEPNPNEIFDRLLLLVLKNEIYNFYLDSKTSEQVARRFAMENATNNASDLIDDLTLEYNKARQGSITQEITEIVAGANAI